jgi:hypothetical protein
VVLNENSPAVLVAIKLGTDLPMRLIGVELVETKFGKALSIRCNLSYLFKFYCSNKAIQRRSSATKILKVRQAAAVVIDSTPIFCWLSLAIKRGCAKCCFKPVPSSTSSGFNGISWSKCSGVNSSKPSVPRFCIEPSNGTIMLWVNCV